MSIVSDDLEWQGEMDYIVCVNISAGNLLQKGEICYKFPAWAEYSKIFAVRQQKKRKLAVLEVSASKSKIEGGDLFDDFFLSQVVPFSKGRNYMCFLGCLTMY